MANIEVHGFSGDQAVCKRDVLIAILRSIGFTDSVVTVVPSTVHLADEPNHPQPFFRIVSTEQEEIDDIVRAMKVADMRIDVEWLIIGGFISSTEMTDGPLPED